MKTSITLKIQGMECPNCAMTLEGIEDKLPGVLRAEASYRRAELLVEYDPALVNEGHIQEAVQRLGYSVDKTGLSGI